MKPLLRLLIRNSAMLCVACLSAGSLFAADPKPAPQEPPLVNPGPVGGPPSDAIVLFDGKDLSQWKSGRGGDAQWKVEDGKEILPGSFTVIFNGVLVQDHVPIKSSTTAAAFTGAVPKGPLVLQDHGSPVRYRNIWIRPL